jgi:hypothetical protein
MHSRRISDEMHYRLLREERQLLSVANLTGAAVLQP